MSRLLMLLALCISSLVCHAQLKKDLDTGDIYKFPTLIYSNAIAAANGMYIAYKNASSLGIPKPGFTIKTIDSRWMVTLNNLSSEIEFTPDSKYALAQTIDDKLLILELGTGKISYFSDINSFHVIYPNKGNQCIVVYRKKSKEQLQERDSMDFISVLDISTGDRCDYLYSEEFCYSKKNSSVILLKKNKATFQICKYSSDKKTEEIIWSGIGEVNKIRIDSLGDQVAFMQDNTLWYCSINGKKRSIKIAIPNSPEFKGLYISSAENFSPSGKFLFFKMRDTSNTSLIPDEKAVEIFSYLDSSFNFFPSWEEPSYLCAYNCKTGEVIRIEYIGDRLKRLSRDEQYAFISNSSGELAEAFWNKKSIYRDYVFSLSDKTKVPINGKGIFSGNQMSPSGAYVINTNYLWEDINCLDVKNGTSKNLTSKLPIPISDNFLEAPYSEKSRGLFLSRWGINDKYVIVYDHYDIWKISLIGDNKFTNLTNGYGRNNHITFRAIDTSLFKQGEEVILSAFNEDTKDQGFFKIRVGSETDPELLTMAPYSFSEIIKLGLGRGYILKRASAAEAPNFYRTIDFRKFDPLSDEHPECKYNWIRSELIGYKTMDGVSSQAILYKPENFDSTKRYPVLFTFYEVASPGLNGFIIPVYSEYFSFNIPLMVSQGYLVCVPDIHFKIGRTAYDIVDCVEGAAYYLSKLNYVDSLHFGACGGSFGGYGVNCLAAFSRKFSALIPISGVSDLVSGYGEAPGIHSFIYEFHQVRMGVSLSTDPGRYLINSPVAFAKNVTSPLLIVNTIFDNKVNVSQGAEFFVGLRREGKPVWMLKYKGDELSHGISDFNDRKDFGIRASQFFGHYLKGDPFPKWMTGEVKSGVAAGFDYSDIKSLPAKGLLRDSI